MTPEELAVWMKNVNTQMLELVLTVGAGKPQWYKDAMTAEIQRRKEAENGGLYEHKELPSVQ
jgi:hypothetical protein